MDASPESSNGRASLQAWCTCLTSVALILVLCALLSYVFVWTIHAEFFDTRDRITYYFAICTAGTCVFSLLFLKVRLLEGPEGIRSVRSSLNALVAAYVLLVVMALGAESLTEQAVTWKSLPRIALWEVPLCIVLMVAMLRMPLNSTQYAVEAACAAVVGGVATGYTLAATLGSLWTGVAISALAWVCVFVKRFSQGEGSDRSSAGMFIGGSGLIVFLQIMFGGYPIKWDLAVLLVILTSCIFVVRVAGLWSMAPPETVVGGRSRRANPWELLPLGWVALLFVSIAWTEPQLATRPPEALLSVSPPTEPSLTSFGRSTGDAAEWRHYDARAALFDSLRPYRQEAEVADLWNAIVEREVWWRRAIKITAWIVMSFFTLVAYLIAKGTGTNVVHPGLNLETAVEGASEPGMAGQLDERSTAPVRESGQVCDARAGV